jgi:hypothetical protein
VNDQSDQEFIVEERDLDEDESEWDEGEQSEKASETESSSSESELEDEENPQVIWLEVAEEHIMNRLSSLVIPEGVSRSNQDLKFQRKRKRITSIASRRNILN